MYLLITTISFKPSQLACLEFKFTLERARKFWNKIINHGINLKNEKSFKKENNKIYKATNLALLQGFGH